MRVRSVVVACLLAVSVLAAACTQAKNEDLVVVVNVPLQRASSIATQIVNGARLAAEQINADGGVRAGARKFNLRIEAVDSGLSPTTTTANVRDAVARKAVAVIDEGTGVDAAWQQARDAGLPICIVYQGAASMIDPVARPNVFRIAPTDHGMAFRLAEYSIPKGYRFALMTDDSTDGTGGERALAEAFGHTPKVVAARIRLAADATDAGVQVLQARRARATALMVWMRPAQIARVIRAARSTGWNVPIFASIAAEDPVVRQALADRPEWLGGVTFAMSRMTSEKGPEPFDAFRTAYEKRFGPEPVGVRARGKEVVQIPDWAMYPYDFVRVLAAAIELSGATGPSQALVAALEKAEVQGANGDERAFNEKSHEGVVDDDVFFANFSDMTWVPVRDDPLSSTLPSLRQTR
jgi:ABC-type branched-subunit amino acid transport system substrate-binding protein